MKAVRFHKTGGPEVLVYEDVPDPTPKDGEVLIKVEAAGINFADVMRRRGDNYPEPSPPPFILGVEVAGTIAAVGKWSHVACSWNARPCDARRRRICAIHLRARSNRRTATAWRWRRQAAAVVAHGLTAALALRKAARLAPGESVLIEAAAGGVSPSPSNWPSCMGLARSLPPPAHPRSEQSPNVSVPMRPSITRRQAGPRRFGS